MKKIISMLIATVMLLSVMSLSAFAATITPDGDGSHEVYAKYVEGTKTDAYKVGLSWGSMNFVYSASTEEWDVDTCTWKTVNAGSWAAADDTANKITITNYSSRAIEAGMTFAATASTGVTGGTFTWGDQTGENTIRVAVESAADMDGAVTETVTFMPAGDLVKTDSNTEAFESVGKITITLS